MLPARDAAPRSGCPPSLRGGFGEHGGVRSPCCAFAGRSHPPCGTQPRGTQPCAHGYLLPQGWQQRPAPTALDPNAPARSPIRLREGARWRAGEFGVLRAAGCTQHLWCADASAPSWSIPQPGVRLGHPGGILPAAGVLGIWGEHLAWGAARLCWGCHATESRTDLMVQEVTLGWPWPPVFPRPPGRYSQAPCRYQGMRGGQCPRQEGTPALS